MSIELYSICMHWDFTALDASFEQHSMQSSEFEVSKNCNYHNAKRAEGFSVTTITVLFCDTLTPNHVDYST